jgi:catechol 2,3-dioxygenase-like lactoylglutathione lyase family enzyme
MTTASRGPALRGLIESSLYVDDLRRARDFYTGIMGLQVLREDERFCGLDVAGHTVLLLFVKRGTLEPVRMPGGTIPPHDGEGRLHLAFAVSRDELPGWEKRLQEAGVTIESRGEWPAGGVSVYFRDPDGHLVELATPGLWPIY